MPQWILIPLGVVIFGAVCYRETRRGRFDEAAILRTARCGMAFAILAAAGLVPLTTGRIADNPALFGAAAGSLIGTLMLAVALSAYVMARFRVVAGTSDTGNRSGRWPDSLPVSAHRISHSLNLLCVVAVVAEVTLNVGEAALSLSGDRHWCGLWNRTSVLRVFGLLACAGKNRLTQQVWAEGPGRHFSPRTLGRSAHTSPPMRSPSSVGKPEHTELGVR